MTHKKLILTLAGLFTLSNVFAQDQLYKKNGESLEVKVNEVTPRTISYKKYDNQDGPTYTIPKGDVSKIVYENGSEDYFGEPRPERATKKVDYGNNILSVMPLQLTTGVGVGIAYERVLDQENILSFYLPVTVAFTDNSFDPIMGPTTGNSTRPTFYFMPGLKFYPTGGKGVVRYAVGPNLVYVQGERFLNDFIYDDFGNIIGQDVGWRTRTALGIMVNNSLNINPSARIHLGLELGLGFTYFNRVANRNTDVEGLVQFGFKVGYRF